MGALALLGSGSEVVLEGGFELFLISSDPEVEPKVQRRLGRCVPLPRFVRRRRCVSGHKVNISIAT